LVACFPLEGELELYLVGDSDDDARRGLDGALARELWEDALDEIFLLASDECEA